MTPVRVALIGCGDIAGQYLDELVRHPSLVEVTTCADVDMDRARARAAEYGVPRAVEPVAALADDDVEICVNLTPPQAHAAVSLAVLRAGKHVYSEKPLAATLADGIAVMAEAERRGHGVVDLAVALREGRPHRAAGGLALHVLDVMEGLLASAQGGGQRVATTTAEPLGLAA
jgi:predicted dehydrogenase